MRQIKTKDVLNILDSEINHIHVRRNGSGWTNWALSASFISVCAIFLTALKESNPTIDGYKHLAMGYIWMSVFIDLIFTIWTIFSTQIVKIENEKYFFTISPQHALISFTKILRNLVLLFVVCFCYGTISKCYFYLFSVSFCAETASLILILGRSYSSQEIFLSKSIANNKFIHGIGFLVSSILIYGYGSFVFSNLLIEEFRLSGILIVLTYILMLLSKTISDEPNLSELRETRKELILRIIKPVDALREIDITLNGAKLDDLIFLYLKKIRKINDRINNVSVNHEIMFAHYKKILSKSPIPETFFPILFVVYFSLFRILKPITELKKIILELENLQKRLSENSTAALLLVGEPLRPRKENETLLKIIKKSKTKLNEMNLKRSELKALFRTEIEKRKMAKYEVFVIDKFLELSKPYVETKV